MGITMKKRIIEIVVMILGIILLMGCILWQKNKEELESMELMEQAKQYHQEEKNNRDNYKISIEGNAVQAAQSELISAYEVINGNAVGEILVSPQQFLEDVACNSIYQKQINARASFDKINVSVDENDILVLEFKVSLLGDNVNLNVSCAGKNTSVYVSDSQQKVYIPISGITGIDGFDFEITSEFSNIVIDEVYLVNYGKNYDISELEMGVFYGYEPNYVSFTDRQRLIDSKSIKLLKKDDSFLSLESDRLVIYRKAENGYETASVCNEIFGAADMEFISDEQMLAVTSGQNGMYIIDISDISDIRKTAHYDSLETASDIKVSGDYVFLCCGYLGVEIVDVSNPSQPEFINNISGDAQYKSCFVDGDYLYVSAYNTNCIDIYDISNLYSPKYLSQIKTGGICINMTVADDVLYAATGDCSSSEISSASYLDINAGSGMEIYDVSDKTVPIHLSTVKPQGTGSSVYNVVCDIQVIGNYAYFTDTFKGLYIYDISDLKHPVCIRSCYLISENSEKQSQMAYLNNILLDDRAIYLGLADLGIYRIEDANCKPIARDYSANYSLEKDTMETVIDGYEVSKFKTDGCVWAVDSKDEDIYVACGDKGIVKLDADLNVVQTFDTGYSVKDVKVYNNYLFTAESEGGIGVYSIEKEIEAVQRFNNDDALHSVTQVEYTPDAKYLLAQTSEYGYAFADISDFENIKVTMSGNSTGLMPFRSIAKGRIANKYVLAYGNENICVYSCENGDLAESLIENAYFCGSGGITQVGDYAIEITDGGYAYLDFIHNDASDVIEIPGADLRGKCSSDGKTLVVSNTDNGEIYIVDVKYINSPVLKNKFKIEGNPDIAYVSDKFILIPCRYGGLIKLTGKS